MPQPGQVNDSKWLLGVREGSLPGTRLAWADRIRHLGMGPLPVPFADLSAQRLAAAIREALDEPYRNRARELARLVNAEDGAETVARRIEQLPG